MDVNNFMTAGSLVSGLGNMALPGLGAVLNPVIGSIGNHLAKKQQRLEKAERYSSLTPIMEKGGYLSLGGALRGHHNLSTYKGRSHQSGGILVNEQGVPVQSDGSAEVEHNEALYRGPKGNYIFSAKLKV